MKNSLHAFAYSTMVGMLFITSCSNTSESKVSSEPKPTLQQTTELTGVPLQKALDAIARYGNWWRAEAEGDSSVHINQVTRAFLIPGNDLINVLKPATDSSLIDFCEYKQARAYLGLDKNNVIHLYLTPVSSNGEDVILTNDSGQIVFDLTLPCPTNCDVTSELYQAFDN